ncbi:MAG: hypothetical protein U9R13_08840 [Campylobacterota bacterium]|nr:hypothetical protein [Campylobacterota bacterium]
MKKIIRLAFTTIVTLMISGCGMSNLSYDNKQLTVQVEKEYLQMDGTLLNERRNNFSSLFLSQKVVRLAEGNLVVYEDARTDLSYEFEPPITRSIKIIFEAKSIIMLYGKSHLYAYQLILKNGKILNVVAQQGDTQQLRFVYGLSTSQLNQMLKQLDPDAASTYYKQVIRLQDEGHAILSKWDVQKVHFVPLVVPLARMMRR